MRGSHGTSGREESDTENEALRVIDAIIFPLRNITPVFVFTSTGIAAYTLGLISEGKVRHWRPYFCVNRPATKVQIRRWTGQLFIKAKKLLGM